MSQHNTLSVILLKILRSEYIIMVKKYSVSVLFAFIMVVIMLFASVGPVIPSGASTPSVSSSNSPPWFFKGAYTNYSYISSVKTNSPPTNISSITPSWLFKGAYVNYTFSSYSSYGYNNGTYNGTYNVSIYKENATSYSVKFVSYINYANTVGDVKETTYANNTTIAGTGISSTYQIGISNYYGFPAFSTYALYFMDSGHYTPMMSGATVNSNINYTISGKTVRADKVNTTELYENLTSYLSYNNGLVLKAYVNSSDISVPSLYLKANSTNIPISGHPPFSTGMRTTTTFITSQYKITSVESNGSFAFNVTSSNSSYFFGQSGNYTASLTNTGNFMALNSTSLLMLKNGKAPAFFDFTHFSVKNVTVTTAAGTFSTYEISGQNATENNMSFNIYVGAYSGLMVKFGMAYSMSVEGYNYSISVNMVLSSTNIPMVASSGYLSGTVSPSGTTLLLSGMSIPVVNGKYNISLTPGKYYLSATHSGYQSKTYTIIIASGKTTTQNITLSAITNSVTISGKVTPSFGSSVFIGGNPVPVNPLNGSYSISVAKGDYTVSAYSPGYFPISKSINATTSQTVNFVLVKEPKYTSSRVANGTNATGYNVTIAKVINGNGSVTVNFTATNNGTLTVMIPYNSMKNVTVAEILNSSVYINNVRDKNFSITFTSNFTVILYVYNLPKDPTLYWAYTPSALPSAPVAPATPFKLGTLQIVAIAVVAVAVIAILGLLVGKRRR